MYHRYIYIYIYTIRYEKNMSRDQHPPAKKKKTENWSMRPRLSEVVPPSSANHFPGGEWQPSCH